MSGGYRTHDRCPMAPRGCGRRSRRPQGVGSSGVKCIPRSKNWTHTYQSSTNLFHKLVEEMRSKECIGYFDSLSAGDLKLWKDMARLYLSSGYVELAGNLPWKLTQKIVTHQESGRSFDIPLWVPLCAVITKNHHAYFSEVDQDGDTIVNLFHNGASPVNPYLIRLNLLSYVARRRRCDVDILRKCYDKLFVDRELEGVAVAFNHALFKLLNCGMHLTPEAPRSSIRALEDYSRTLGSFKPGFPFWPWHGHSIHPLRSEQHVLSR